MPPPGKLPLLIVEDDANTRFLVKVAAERSGYFEPVTQAIDGQAALDALQSGDATQLPRLIITDLYMPRVTGLELLRALKRDPFLRSIPVAILTSSDAATDREQAMAEGAVSFVVKPYGVDALMNVLTTLRDTCDETAGTAGRS